jgi:hypothetical protein
MTVEPLAGKRNLCQKKKGFRMRRRDPDQRIILRKQGKAAGGKRLTGRGIEEGKPCRTLNR